MRWLIAVALAGLLAVPVAASGHPLERNLGVFTSEMPEVDLLGAAAGRSYFRGSPPAEYDKTANMQFVGFSARPAAGSLSLANSDVAFQGNLVYQGTFPGFRIVDVTNAMKPKEIINYEGCRHPSGQGDVIIYGDIMTRSWDSASSNGMPAGGWPCGDEPVMAGEEGLHVFDVGDPTAPETDAFIDLPCGSHTATGVPDPANDRLIVYSTPSSGACSGIDVIEIPVDDPEAASYHHFDPSGTGIACHDTGVILGDVLKAACAGGQGFALWSMAEEDGGSLIDPALLYTRNMKVVDGININTGHSAAFSNDGETLIFGHEPSGGTSARCQATGTLLGNATYPVQTDDMKSFFFFDVASGTLEAKWTLPRPQSAFENCTLHNYNVVPSKKRDILVHGSYQAGIGVLDFSDLDDIKEIAYADPKPLDPNAFTIGGDWSSHYYNGLIYESDITRGLLAWEIRGDAMGGTKRLNRLNPQTQVFTTSG
ncbi:MAG TPA: hypothetical protein VD836_11750 [Solirubrobacteraceae bacterium]|nr:hypothetical protein [Solirubrobacteraceae bacterium]